MDAARAVSFFAGLLFVVSSSQKLLCLHGLDCIVPDEHSLLALRDARIEGMQKTQWGRKWRWWSPKWRARWQRRHWRRAGKDKGKGKDHAITVSPVAHQPIPTSHHQLPALHHSLGPPNSSLHCGSRKEISRWTDAEFERFAFAINQLKQDGRYDRYVREHEDAVHGMRGFFQWHHVYLSRFENEIREVLGDNCFGLPYWDEAADSGRESSAPVWRIDRFGSLPPGGCIRSKYFNWNPCIERNGKFSGRNHFANPLQVQSVIDRMQGQDVGRLRLMVEDGEGFHADGHIFIGGNMASTQRAPSDPVFWLHHAYFDYMRQLSKVTGGHWSSLLQLGNVPLIKYVERTYEDDYIEHESHGRSSLKERLDLGIKYCNQRKLMHCLSLIRSKGRLQHVPRITSPACPEPRQTLTAEEVEFDEKWERMSHQVVTMKQRQTAVDDSEVIYKDDWPTTKPAKSCDDQVCYDTTTVVELCLHLAEPAT